MDRLHCFAESGNAYKVALMLTLCGEPWEAVPVAFFDGETRTDTFHRDVNAMGEIPVLERRGERLTQSGLILQRLARETGRFAPNSDREIEDCWRWMLFDNHKFTANLATYRFLRCFAPEPVDDAVLAFMRARSEAAYRIVDRHLETTPFLLGPAPTIADLSLSGYVFYPAKETGLDIANAFPNIEAWRSRIAELPGWRSPYDLMPRAWLPHSRNP